MNKIAIIYASKHGTTEKVAQRLAAKLDGDVSLISLKQNKNPNIDSYDTVILGTAIYAGTPQKVMTVFCQRNESELLKKTIGLFICGMQPGAETREKEIIDAYSEVLRQHAKASAFLGGEFLFEKLNFFEKLIVKKVSKATASVSSIDEDAIILFANEMKID